MSLLFSTQTITSRYDVFAKESVKRISSLDIEILMWNEIVTYLNKEHIVPKTMIFKKGNDIVSECDR